MFFSKRPIGTWEVVETVIDDALDQFYKIVHDDEELASFMVGRNTQRLKQMQRDHWQATFTSGFNSSYYERLGRIGKAHANVSLPPHFFVRGYGVLMEALMLRLRRKMTNRSDAAQQVLKEIIDIIFQDLSVGIKVYYDVLQDGKRAAGQDVLNHSDEFASRMQQLAGEVQSIASGVDQMDASISNITLNVDETSTFARDASDRADSAADSMRAVTTASEEIGSFLSIITEIADKTKLLAVNAAIEAARAGEAGKGFTVVADEVRQLAEGTEAGAKDVANKVEEIQRAVSGLRRTIESVQESFQHVLSASDKIATAVHQQSSATRDMSNRMGTVKTGIEDQIQDLETLVSGVYKSMNS